MCLHLTHFCCKAYQVVTNDITLSGMRNLAWPSTDKIWCPMLSFPKTCWFLHHQLRCITDFHILAWLMRFLDSHLAVIIIPLSYKSLATCSQYKWEFNSWGRLVSWLILASDQTVANLILGIHGHMLSICRVISCTNVVLRKIGWLMLETIESILLRKTGYRALEASPLKDLLGKTPCLMPKKFAVASWRR